MCRRRETARRYVLLLLFELIFEYIMVADNESGYRG